MDFGKTPTDSGTMPFAMSCPSPSEEAWIPGYHDRSATEGPPFWFLVAHAQAEAWEIPDDQPIHPVETIWS